MFICYCNHYYHLTNATKSLNSLHMCSLYCCKYCSYKLSRRVVSIRENSMQLSKMYYLYNNLTIRYNNHPYCCYTFVVFKVHEKKIKSRKLYYSSNYTVCFIKYNERAGNFLIQFEPPLHLLPDFKIRIKYGYLLCYFESVCLE